MDTKQIAAAAAAAIVSHSCGSLCVSTVFHCGLLLVQYMQKCSVYPFTNFFSHSFRVTEMRIM